MADSYDENTFCSIVSPYREVNFYQQVEQVLENHQIDKNTQDWILASLPSWNNIEELGKCKKLPPDKLESISEDLRQVFDHFYFIKKALTEDFSLIGLEKDSQFVSDVITNMFNGSKHLETFLLNDREAQKWFSKADVEKLNFNIFKQHLVRRTPSYLQDSMVKDPTENFEPSAPTFSMLDLSSLGPLIGYTPPASIQNSAVNTLQADKTQQHKDQNLQMIPGTTSEPSARSSNGDPNDVDEPDEVYDDSREYNGTQTYFSLQYQPDEYTSLTAPDVILGSDSVPVGCSYTTDGNALKLDLELDVSKETERVVIAPLLVTKIVIQEGAPIEKFELCDKGMNFLYALGINQLDDSVKKRAPVFDASSYIDWKALNKVKIECSGLFGPFEVVLSALEETLSTEILDLIKDSTVFDVTGLYLINIPELSKNYVLFYSKNNEDFEFVVKESRSVFFLRYLTELTHNVAMCFDQQNSNYLSDNQKCAIEEPRFQFFCFDPQKTEEEKFTLKKLSALSENFAAKNQSLFPFKNGFFSLSCDRVEAKHELYEYTLMGTVEDLGYLLDEHTITDLGVICDEFKFDYVARYFPQDFEAISTQTRNEVNSTQPEKRALDILLKILVDNHLELNFPFAFQLAKKLNEEEKDPLMKYVGQDRRSISVLISNYRARINEKIKRNSKFEKLEKDIKQFLTWSNLKNTKQLSSKYNDLPFVDLKPYQREKLTKNGHTDFKKEIQRLEPIELSPISKSVKDFKTFVSETFSATLKKDKDLLSAFKSRARALGSRISEGLRDEFLSRHILCHFNSSLASRQCAATEGICDISKSGREHNFEARFRKFHSNDVQLNYEVSLFPWPERSLESSSERDLQVIGDSNVNHVGNFSLRSGEVVQAFYPIDAVTVLLVINLEAGSKTVIYNLQSQKEKLCIPIGKTISASSFDPTGRVVALHSDEDFGSVQVYKMDEDYRTRHTYPMVDTYATDFDSGTDVGVFSFCLQPRSDCIWVAMGKRVQKINYTDRKFLLNPVFVESDIERLVCTGDGKCVLACTVDQTLYPIMTETAHVLTSLPLEGNSVEIKTFVQGSKSLVLLPAESRLFLNRVLVSGALSVETKGKGNDNLEKEVESKEEQKEHWVNCLYWMYSKFPCDDLLDNDQEMLDIWMLDCCCSTELQSKMRKEIKSILKKLSNSNKPMNFVNVHFEEMSSKVQQVERFHKTEILGSMLLKLIMFVPLQIVRCQSNSFNILAANEGSPRGQVVKNTFDLASTISFGYYDIVFSSWTGDIKVISSMGKQSSGKSYLLNHLAGTSFNTAGTRCTDGCWMTVKATEDCLYVILDFEGLGSFERTDQEDMLLSLFNSAISTATIFKTEKQFERDVDKLFDKINLGSDQLQGTDRVFQGMFMIFINDVPFRDVRDTPREFVDKLERIIQRSDKNFVRKLYRSGFSIMCFPMFETEAYFESTKKLLGNIRDRIHAVFSGGLVFADTMKLLMAKLAINDFTPLGRQQIEERIRKLNMHMADIIRYGQLASGQMDGQTDSALQSYDDPTFSVATLKSVALDLVGNVELDDHKTILQESGFDDLVTRFVEMSKLTCDNIDSWRSDLELYISQCMMFRFDRIRDWIKENLRKWRQLEDSESKDLIGMQFEKLDVQNLKYAQWFCLCNEKCSSCFLKCTHIANHDDIVEHECSTNHVCSGICSYCSDTKDTCALSFGHEGSHNCLHADHLCTEPCRFKGVNGCAGQCNKTIDHAGKHECAQKSHPCNQICSLEVCTGRCLIDSEIAHTVHKCSKDQCIAGCCIDNCSNKCTSTDHFHGTELSEKYRKEQNLNWEPAFFLDDGVSVLDTSDHFCGKGHTCDNYCVHEGFCQVITEKHVKDEVFVGKKETFNYSLKFVETGKKHQCRQKIAPFMKTHDGDHLCSVVAHICTEKCPTCKNICNKPIGHQAQGDKLHHTNHGNMRNCNFVANADEINIGEHVYQVGEPAVAEMCHIFCRTLGRGHIHVVNCSAIDTKLCKGDKNRRHATVKYQPNEDEPKDELTHKEYWNYIGFEDPCSHELASEDFEKCPAYCDASCHDEKDKKYCTLPLWHAKITSLEQLKTKKTGIISKDGHLFPCDHTVSASHFVLCLDDSGSMFGKPWEELKTAVSSFINKRLALNPNAPDRVSIAIHNAQTRIVANFISLKDYKSDLLKFEGGENDFALALMNAGVLIEKNLQKNMTPVLVFMSDGIWNNGEEEMKQMRDKFSIQHGLKVYTIGFGKINFDKLKKLAEIGKGEYIEAIDGVQLKNSFLEISSKHPPSIGISVQQAKARGEISF